MIALDVVDNDGGALVVSWAVKVQPAPPLILCPCLSAIYPPHQALPLFLQSSPEASTHLADIKADVYEVLGNLLDLRSVQLPEEERQGHRSRKRKLANVDEAWEEVGVIDRCIQGERYPPTPR